MGWGEVVFILKHGRIVASIDIFNVVMCYSYELVVGPCRSSVFFGRIVWKLEPLNQIYPHLLKAMGLKDHHHPLEAVCPV